MSTLQSVTQSLDRDPVMATLIIKFPPTLPQTSHDLFRSLLESIISQQLSVKASKTIFESFVSLFPNGQLSPQHLLSLSPEALRAAGLSRQKSAYLYSLASAITDGSLDLSALKSLSDEDVIKELIKVKGIGRWTAEMFLIFSLARPDVFSVGDLGLRTAVSRLYGVDREDRVSIEQLSQTWAPFRSFAARLLWQSLDNT